jgi:hypothetical protein
VLIILVFLSILLGSSLLMIEGGIKGFSCYGEVIDLEGK